MFDGRMPLKKKYTQRKLQKKVLYLCFGLMGVFFGISCLGLRLCIFSLGDHIPDRESILELIGLNQWLNLLALSSPY